MVWLANEAPWPSPARRRGYGLCAVTNDESTPCTPRPAARPLLMQTAEHATSEITHMVASHSHPPHSRAAAGTRAQAPIHCFLCFCRLLGHLAPKA